MIRAIRIWWCRWRMAQTDAELRDRSKDGSLSDEQAVNYMRNRNWYADQERALRAR